MRSGVGWMGKGWGQDDIFIDLHNMKAGEKWRETLVKANVACDALFFSPRPRRSTAMNAGARCGVPRTTARM